MPSTRRMPCSGHPPHRPSHTISRHKPCFCACHPLCRRRAWVDPRSTGSWHNNSSPAQFASVCTPWLGAAANWTYGARHARWHRADEDRLNPGIHHTVHGYAAVLGSNRILSGFIAALGAGRGQRAHYFFESKSQHSVRAKALTQAAAIRGTADLKLQL